MVLTIETECETKQGQSVWVARVQEMEEVAVQAGSEAGALRFVKALALRRLAARVDAEGLDLQRVEFKRVK